MVPGDKQGGKRPILRPVQLALFLGAAIPYPTEVAAADHAVIFGQLRLLKEDFFFETPEIAMRVTCDKYGHNVLTLCSNFSIFSARFPRLYPES